MQSVTSTLAAAITGLERRVGGRLLLDSARTGLYADDLSANVDSVSIERSITTDLPDAAKVLSGDSAASAVIELSGSYAGTPVDQLFSAHNAGSPWAARDRIGMPVDFDWGLRGTAGWEYAQGILGRVRSPSVDPHAGTVTLDVTDLREKFTSRTALPVVVADELSGTAPYVKPGLSGSFLMDRVARANGFYETPPVRTGCKLSATMKGSTWPEIGTLVESYGTAAGPKSPPAFIFYSSLQYPERLYAGATKNQYTALTGLTTNNSSNILVEIFEFWSSTPAADEPMFLITNGTDRYGCWLDSTGTVNFGISRNGGAGWTTVGSGPTPSLSTLGILSPHYVAMQVNFSSTGGTWTLRVDGTTTTRTFSTGSVTGRADMTTVYLGYGLKGDGTTFASSGGTFRGVQVTTEGPGVWNDGFVATSSIPPAIGTLTATPDLEYDDDWALLNALASAEQGFVSLDESGRLLFRNRAYLSGGSAVTTISTSTTLKSLASSESVDAVRNRVRVTARPVKLYPPAGAAVLNTMVWSAAEIYTVPASGSLTVRATTENLIYSLRATGAAAWIVSGAYPAAGVLYRANDTQDGTGVVYTDLTGSWTKIDGHNYDITLTNPHAFPVYLVNPTGSATPGDPMLRLLGRDVRPTTVESSDASTTSGYVTVERFDSTSAGKYGEQVLELPDTPARQTLDSVTRLADDLLAALKDPHPVLANVELVGDPRLQLGDRVRVVEPTGLVLDDEFWVVSITTSLTSSLTQTVSLRKA